MSITAQSGVTLVELLLIVALIAIIAAAAGPFGSRSFTSQQQAATVNILRSSLGKAQAQAMGIRNDAAWGVCLIGGTIRLYSGSCGAPSFNEDYAIPGSITVTGLSDVTFDAVRGAPSAALSVSVASAFASTTVSMNSTGMVEVD